MGKGEGREEEEEGMDLRAAAPLPRREGTSCLSVPILPIAFFWAHLVHL